MRIGKENSVGIENTGNFSRLFRKFFFLKLDYEFITRVIHLIIHKIFSALYLIFVVNKKGDPNLMITATLGMSNLLTGYEVGNPNC